ncbi:MAG: PIG-L family deacetylase [Actinomycetota bacterium]|nr:PIG-L family deacetylase [Actinomycetota bacterium]
MKPFRPDPPSCFISTHLDDVALSCSHWLAANPAASVVTVFAGAPSIRRRDGWNFDTTGETVALKAIDRRRSEDAAAMAILGASPYWIELWDAQYVAGHRQDSAVVQARIRDVLDSIRPRSVIAPLGIHHPDHVAVADACAGLAQASELTWYCYLDMPYARSFPAQVQPRLAALSAGGTIDLVEREPFRPTTDIKDRAVRLYRSQLDLVRADHPGFEPSLTDPERFWAMERADERRRSPRRGSVQAVPSASARAQR